MSSSPAPVAGRTFGGLAFPFLREKLAGRMSPVIRGAEAASCPSLTQGVYAYDFGDTAGMTPLMKMHTLGHDFPCRTRSTPAGCGTTG